MDWENVPQPVASLMQVALRQLGHYKGTTRGIPGPQTKAAYEAYLSSLSNDLPFSEVLAQIAITQIGKEEVGTNGGPVVRNYQRATWYATGPWPWCAAFVCWVFREAISAGGKWPERRPTTPAAFGFEKWAKKNGAEFISAAAKKTAKRGDIIIFKFSHIGIVVEDQKDLNEPIRTVEGNTNPEGGRDGDGVYSKTRKTKQVRSLIRL